MAKDIATLLADLKRETEEFRRQVALAQKKIEWLAKRSTETSTAINNSLESLKDSLNG